jgi:hypothetical protein
MKFLTGFISGSLALIISEASITASIAKEVIAPEEQLSEGNTVRRPSLSLKKFAKQVSEARKNADQNKLLELASRFESLSYSEDEWSLMSAQGDVKKYPSQKNAREAVGGFLFYPPEIEDWVAFSETRDLLTRRDIVVSLAVAAKFNHPFAKYYFAYALDLILEKLNKEATYERSAFVKGLFKEAFTDLEVLMESDPRARYIIGRNHLDEALRIGHYSFDVQKALEIHQRGDDPQNRLQVLVIQRRYERYETPSKKDFETLGDECSYPLAYVEGAQLKMDFSEKVKLLGKASEFGCPQASLLKGKAHKKEGNFEEALMSFEEAAKAGLGCGYTEVALLLEERNKDLPKTSDKDRKQWLLNIAKIGNSYDKALLSNEFRAVPQQINFLKAQKFFKTKEQKKLFLPSLLRAVALGSIEAHQNLTELFEKQDYSDKQAYSPQEFITVIQKFYDENH